MARTRKRQPQVEYIASSLTPESKEDVIYFLASLEDAYHEGGIELHAGLILVADMILKLKL